jgi:polar amino acid transport system substrate-binding protein
MPPLRDLLLAAGLGLAACRPVDAAPAHPAPARPASAAAQPPLATTAAPPPATPGLLRLCTLDNPYPPYTQLDGRGQMQLLVRQLAQDVGWQVANVTAPRARCQLYLKDGKVDAMIVTYLPERAAIGVFPMAAGASAPDTHRALGTPRYSFFRRVGTPVAWDGTTLSGLNGLPLGVQYEFVQGVLLKARGIPVDDSTKTSVTNFEKLLLGRLGAALTSEAEGAALLQEPRFHGKLEPVPTPYLMPPLYLHVSKPFYAEHRDVVEAMWSAAKKHHEADGAAAAPHTPR